VCLPAVRATGNDSGTHAPTVSREASTLATTRPSTSTAKSFRCVPRRAAEMRTVCGPSPQVNSWAKWPVPWRSANCVPSVAAAAGPPNGDPAAAIPVDPSNVQLTP
jgi:hypothetical protein